MSSPYRAKKRGRGKNMFNVKTEIIEEFMIEHNMTNRDFAKHCDVPLTAVTRMLHTKMSYNFIFFV